MHVTGNPEIRPRQRLPGAAVLALLLSSFAVLSQAVEFDERLKAPQTRSNAALKSEVESFATTHARIAAASPAELVSSAALSRESFELKWQLTRAIDERRPIGELAEFGITPRGDGSYEIDGGAHPYWRTFDEDLWSILPTANLDTLGVQLISRGFREPDVAALKEYVASHDPNAMAAAATLPIAISFSRVVKKFDKIKRPAGKDLVLSYIYQRNKADAQARRAWAEGLLKQFDAQRVRVLHSFFSEMKGITYLAPSDTDAGVAGILATMRLPDFEQQAIADSKGATP